MPNRIIKDSIHTSEKVDAMTDFQFRLWVNLITYVDDFGRGDARPAVIRGTCFPLRERMTNKDVEAALNALAGIGCVSLYEIDGRPYLYFPNWESHQTIRNKKSRFPAPEKIESNCKQLNSIASKCSRNPIQSNTIQSEFESESKTGGEGGGARAGIVSPDELEPTGKDAQYQRVLGECMAQLGFTPMGLYESELYDSCEELGFDTVISTIRYANLKAPDNPQTYLRALLEGLKEKGIKDAAGAEAAFAEYERSAKGRRSAKRKRMEGGEGGGNEVKPRQGTVI